MTKIEVTLISGRTSKQGVGLEEGKTSKTYADSVNHIRLSPEDVERLGPGKNVQVSTDYGSVTVYVEEDKNLDMGLAFFPYGPWANQVYSTGTQSTGMPMMKGIPATIEPGQGEVLTLEELVDVLRGNA